jgi:von Willebrand factor type D domain
VDIDCKCIFLHNSDLNHVNLSFYIISDPHFRTHDGTLYSFHGECDLLMARSRSFGEGLGLDVHARTQIIAGTWSLVSNAAVRVGDDTFEVANDGVHYLNGIPDIELPYLMIGRYQISKTEEMLESKGDEDVGEASSLIRTWYTIELEKGEKITITNFRRMLSINVDANLSDTVGMLGSSVNPGLVGRDLETIVGDSDDMGMQWQVNDVDPILFHEIRAPQFPEKCVLPVASTHRQLRQSDKMYRKAKAACAGIDTATHSFCIEDVLATGDTTVAMAYGSVF